jgi:hypothetical protein
MQIRKNSIKKTHFIKHKNTRHLQAFLPACGSRAANLTRVLT